MQVETVEKNMCAGHTLSICQELCRSFRVNMEILFDHFDLEGLVSLAEKIKVHPGALFCTGIGKSGIIAQKIVMTLSSCGIKAFYLSAQDALHGDIGVVSSGDMVLMLSKSGESEELLELCPTLKSKNVSIISVVANAASRLAKESQITFIVPDLKELCPYDIAPTSSTMAQLVFGDLLAMTLMRIKKVGLDDFVQNHPSGRIGRRKFIKVRDLMLPFEATPICGPEDTLCDILFRLSNGKCGCICVVGEGRELLGIFTDGDLRRSLEKFGQEAVCQKMHTLMTCNPKTIHEDALALEAMRKMELEGASPITILPVVDEGTLSGLVKMHDIVQAGI
jgi:arabinose-5-phosphate isomerase